MTRSCATCGRIIPATEQRCSRHADQFKADRNAQRRLYADPRWIELRDRKRAEQQGVCQDCGYTQANEVHHRYSVKIIGTSGVQSDITSTTPWTWATNDQIWVGGTYESV